MKKILQAPIKFYKIFLSPLLGPACRYHPSCSNYALEALETHGAVKGSLLAAARLLRCHPWARRNGGDPVPEAFDWRGFFGYKRPRT